MRTGNKNIHTSQKQLETCKNICFLQICLSRVKVVKVELNLYISMHPLSISSGS